MESGYCYRLYTEATFLSLKESVVPEILRCDMCSVVLQLKALGIHDVLNFEFMSRPPRKTLLHGESAKPCFVFSSLPIQPCVLLLTTLLCFASGPSALERLYVLGCLDSRGFLTEEGRLMAAYPLSPQCSKALIASAQEQFACSAEMLTLVSMLSVESLFVSQHRKSGEDDSKPQLAKRRFGSLDGEFVVLSMMNGYFFCFLTAVSEFIISFLFSVIDCRGSCDVSECPQRTPGEQLWTQE